MIEISQNGLSDPANASALRSEGRIVFRSVLWIFVVTGFSILMVAACGLYAHLWHQVEPFDSARWHANVGGRASLAEGLLERRDLDGLSREQILAMLDSGRPAHASPPWELVYDLGVSSSEPYDGGYVSLAIRFDDSGTVAEARVVFCDG